MADRHSGRGRVSFSEFEVDKINGGTGKYQGASGGGTYINENLTDTLSGGTYKGTIVLP